MARLTKKDLTAKIEKFLELKQQIEELTKEQDAIKDALKAEASAAESRTIVLGEHSITLSERSRSSINVKEFTAAHPRLAAKFTKTTTYDVLTVK